MQDTFKYGLIGYSGRLGSEVKNLFDEMGHQLVFTADLNGENKRERPQLIIDCTLPDAFDHNIQIVRQFKTPFIIATTGLSKENINTLKKLSETIPVVQSFNFSLGVQILLDLTKRAAALLGGWDVEITETHHRMKKDKPSGTAKMIQDIFKDKNVNVSSLRLGGVSGDHTVEFGSMGETLKITHHAISRRTFAEGILKSAEFILDKKNGIYSFADVVLKK